MKNASTENIVILGIDPGTIFLGYALISVRNKNINILDLGNLNLKSFTDHHEKLAHIYTQMSNIIEKYRPDEFAIESPFYNKNPQSMHKLGRAQGVCIAVAMKFHLRTAEYSPKKIKQSVAGHGNASKEQVARMIEKQFHVNLEGFKLDATDALSVAICHALACNNPLAGIGKSNSWKKFLSDNPDRIAG